MDDETSSPGLSARELMSFVSAEEAAAISKVDAKTYEREHRAEFEYVSPRRKMTRLHLALRLPRPVLPALEKEPPPKVTPRPVIAGVAASRIGRPRKQREAAARKSKEKETAEIA
jgi:hypothetical protein